MDIRANFDVNKDAAVEGIWVKFGGKARIKIAKAGNRAFTRLARRRMDEEQIDPSANDDATEDRLRDLMISVEAETILLDFEGFTDGDKPVKYSREKAIEYLQMPEFRDEVLARARNHRNFLLSRVEKQGNDFALISTGA